MRQNRAGNQYEAEVARALTALGMRELRSKTLASALEQRRLLLSAEGVDPETDNSHFYVLPPKTRAVRDTPYGQLPDAFFPGTHIQPDVIVLRGIRVIAVVYVTHWSNARSCKYKFWRTWEEYVDQLSSCQEAFLSINLVFEARPAGADTLCITGSSELPTDPDRNRPIGFVGWDPGVTWAMVDTFDVTGVVPLGWLQRPESEQINNLVHLFQRAFDKPIKKRVQELRTHFGSMKLVVWSQLPPLVSTNRSDKIGLLHLYAAHRLAQRTLGGRILELGSFIREVRGWGDRELKTSYLQQEFPGTLIASQSIPCLHEWLQTLGSTFVRTGAKPKSLAAGDDFNGHTLNDEFEAWLRQLSNKDLNETFIASLEALFTRFDEAFGVSEAFADLSASDAVDRKVDFVYEKLVPAVNDGHQLAQVLLSFGFPGSPERAAVSLDTQNWPLELLIYALGLNTVEHINARFSLYFAEKGHHLRPHAPYGDVAKTCAFLFQGRDLCEQWGESSGRRTLGKDEFRKLCWETMAHCMADAFEANGSKLVPPEAARQKYIEAKSRRLLSSELNTFHVVVETALGDVCKFKFSEVEENEDAVTGLNQPTVFTDIVRELYGARPLETWFEGESNDGTWLIKCQSAQNGNEGHKTKELSGRVRALKLKHDFCGNPKDSSKWGFSERATRRMALVLDGTWGVEHKLWLLEAGWDWVGDITELASLRELMNTQVGEAPQRPQLPRAAERGRRTYGKKTP